MCAIAVPICTILAVFGDRASAAVQTYYQAHRPHVHMRIPERWHLWHHPAHAPAPEATTP